MSFESRAICGRVAYSLVPPSYLEVFRGELAIYYVEVVLNYDDLTTALSMLGSGAICKK